MKTVLELLGPSTGGIRRHVGALVEGLPAHGWRTETAGPARVLDGIAALDHHVRVPNPGPALLGATRALRRAVDRSEAAVVHAHGLKAGWLAVLTRPGVPVVVTVHNLVLDEAAGAGAPLLRRLEGWLPARADRTIAVSQAIAERFAGGRGTDRVTVIRPAGPAPAPRRGADEVRADLGVTPGTPLVVSLARLHPQKDLPTLLRAAEQLAQVVPGVRVVIAGEGPEADSLAALQRQLGLEATVAFIPPTDDAAGLLAAADVVAVSSSWESGPLVVAEALELARPVVSTPVGFVPELLSDGRAGLLVPIGDAPALARALAATLQHPEESAARAELGRHRVAEQLDRAGLVEQVAAVYDDVVAARAEVLR